MPLKQLVKLPNSSHIHRRATQRNQGSTSWSTILLVHMQQFKFFGLVLGRNLLQHTDSFSVCLQRKSLSAAESQALAAMTIRTLKNMRADDKCALFWKDVTTLADNNLVNAPVLPRRRRLPARYGDAPVEFDETPEFRYRHVYFDALDKLTMSITDRFDQHDCNIYMNSEGLLLKTAKMLHQHLTQSRNYMDMISCHLHYKDTSKYLAVIFKISHDLDFFKCVRFSMI